MTQRVLVCGGRDFADTEKLFRVLSDRHDNNPFSLLIHGAAKGADTLASEWAFERGVPQQAYPADWARDGRAAGPIRNRLMLEEGKPDLVIAFPGGKGTENMRQQAFKAGVPVIDYN
jgi:hypothetical protein